MEVTTEDGATLQVPNNFVGNLGLLLSYLNIKCDNLDDAASFLVVALYGGGIVLAERAHADSREAVSLNTYTMVLEQKHRTERLLHKCRRQLRPGQHTTDLHGEFVSVIESLCGQEHPSIKPRMSGVDERLRQLRLLLLGVGLDTPATKIPL